MTTASDLLMPHKAEEPNDRSRARRTGPSAEQKMLKTVHNL